MKKAIGIGGIFFKSKNPQELAAWYQKHLEIDFVGNVYADFKFSSEGKGWQAFSFFNADTKYF